MKAGRQDGRTAGRRGQFLAGALILFSASWSQAELGQGLAEQFEQARFEAPQVVNDWVDTLGSKAANVVALIQVQGGGWCTITLDGTGQPNETQCIQPETGELGTLSARFTSTRARDAQRRGTMSERMHRHLLDDPHGITTAVVWARFVPPRRDAGLQFEHEPLQLEIVDLCSATPGCTAEPLQGAPAALVRAPASLFRRLARSPLIGAIDYSDPDEVAVEQAGGHQTMECVRMDEANAEFSWVDGSGINVAVLEGGMPTALQAPMIDPGNITTNAPAGVTTWHAGQTLSVLKGDSSSSATPRAIEGSASGAKLIVACKAEACFPCIVDADCVGSVTCDSAGFCAYASEHRSFLALDWLASLAQPADVVNISLGIDYTSCGGNEATEYDKFSRVYDYWPTVWPYPVITHAAGNHGVDRVSSSSMRNGIVVGGVDHQATVDRDDHQMWDTARCICDGADESTCSANSCVSSYECKGDFGAGCGSKTSAFSCWAVPSCYWDFVSCRSSGSQGRNRIQNGYEVPHVVAPGEKVLVVSEWGDWWEGTGTSWATPHVSGIAARVLQLNGTLKSYPEAVRAIVLASATESMDAVSLRLTDGVDDLDGAGEVDSLEAELLAYSFTSEHNEWCSELAPCESRGANWGPLVSNDFSEPGNYYEYDLHFVPTAGADTAQIALTWMVNVTCDPASVSCSGDPQSPMTLAMWLYRKTASGWSFVDYSMLSSDSSNCLFIHTAVDPNAQYRLRINYPGKVDNRTTYYGLAWTTY